MTAAVTDIGATVESMLSGSMNEAEAVRAFTALAGHKMTAGELAEAAKTLLARAVRIELPGSPIDTCGTGGSGKSRINTSTIASFVVAAAGGCVAKHGNRASAGRCGSFDVLEGLGAKIDLTPDQAADVYADCGLVFLFAPVYHPAMRAVAGARKRYGKPTIFNLLGPLCNPAGIRKRLLGTAKREQQKLLAGALRLLGDEGSLVVCGEDNLDEITVCGATFIRDAATGNERTFHPADIGLREHPPQAVEGGDVQTNVAIARRILGGDATPAQRDLVLANAAHALSLTPIATTIREALAMAEKALDSGAANALLKHYIASTRRFA